MPADAAASPLARIQEALGRAGADLLVVAPGANLRFAFGLERAPVALERVVALLVTPAASAMVLPDFDAEEFAQSSGHNANFPWTDRDGPAGAVQRAFASLALPSAPRCLLDPDLSFLHQLALREQLGERPPQSAGPLLAELRLVKDAAAQAAIAAAGAIVSVALDAGLHEAQPGMSERRLQRIVADALWDAGADEIGPVLVQAGANAAAPHHLADDTPLREGESVLIDITAVKRGHWADITQQVVLGAPPAGYLDAYAAVQEAQRAGVAAARAGASADEVARAASAPILAVPELAPWGGTRTGHGIGLDLHEAPSVVEGCELALPAGAAITVEPGVYLPGRFGIRIEDTVIVGEQGPRAVTRGDRELIVR